MCSTLTRWTIFPDEHVEEIPRPIVTEIIEAPLLQYIDEVVNVPVVQKRQC